ncbi:hypothetical protein BCF46_1758 [Litoreibacter meonggei]|uniref:Nitroreductase family protein n=1 Tax=Litoreibacter meonggei TaxID=1049199 RepID=A0A497WQA9_9RHOB|nr:twin-arginine translocation pathway signal protein [Litoreibacter meonggei]RLJ51544.1 hypothetical protein BCF46_1758 [Litoreibacter meonggei]
MTLTRRKTLALLGGGTLLAATAASAGFVVTRTPHKALAPWDQAGQPSDPRLWALSYGLLAPNPHNRQPWVIDLQGEDKFTVWRDPERDLPVTDPFARQLTIGMGCFLELTRMAASELGLALEMNLFPEGDEGPVANCTLTGGGQSDPLFAHVLERRSHKDAFEPTQVTKAASMPLAPFGQVYLGGTEADRLREIAVEAWMIEASTPAAWQESIDLLRIGKVEINAQPDGIDAGGPFLEGLALAGLFSREAAADLENPGTQGAIEDTRTAILGAPAFVVQTSTGNSRIDQIETGARWLRLNLAATGAGLALRPVSQALQEYPEMAGPFEAIQSEFSQPGETVQMLGLLGYGAKTPRTPRWPLETRLRNA